MTSPDPSAHDSLARAVEQLREQPLPQVVEIADDVLRRTLATPRRSVLVRARAPHDYLRVSSTAITAVLRERIDTGLATAAVGRIVLDVARDEALEALTVELFVQYGADILALADRTRSLANEALVDLIGPGAPGSEVAVTVSHVHVSDVTVGDPHLVDPGEE